MAGMGVEWGLVRICTEWPDQQRRLNPMLPVPNLSLPVAGAVQTTADAPSSGGPQLYYLLWMVCRVFYGLRTNPKPTDSSPQTLQV